VRECQLHGAPVDSNQNSAQTARAAALRQHKCRQEPHAPPSSMVRRIRRDRPVDTKTNVASPPLDPADRLHSNIVVACFSFAHALHWSLGDFDLLSWPISSALLIIGLGAPHGALDVAVASQRWDLGSNRKFVVFIVKYAGLAAWVACAWWLSPGLSLAAFLLLSAHHFGGDWIASAASGRRFLLGASMLSATAMLHQHDIATIFGWLAPQNAADLLATLMNWMAPFLIAASVMLTVFSTRSKSTGHFEIIIVLVSAIILPPITFFIVYFCGLHSVRHLLAVRSELRDHTMWELASAAAPYTILAIAGSAVGSAAFLQLGPGPALISSVFITLAALTVPHIVLMDWAMILGTPEYRVRLDPV
jgi:beta-carotene 15,15'-dioxygenase